MNSSTQVGFFMMAYLGVIAPIVGLAALEHQIGTTDALGLTGAVLILLTGLGLTLTSPRRLPATPRPAHT